MLHQMQLRLSPSVTVFTYRAGEEIAIARPGAFHNVRVEPPAFSAMHFRIDPQRRPNIGSHALTLGVPTDT